MATFAQIRGSKFLPLEWVSLKDENGNDLRNAEGKKIQFKAGRRRISYAKHERLSAEISENDNLLDVLPRYFWGFGGIDGEDDMTPSMPKEERKERFNYFFKMLCLNEGTDDEDDDDEEANAEVATALYGYVLFCINRSSNQSKSRKRR